MPSQLFLLVEGVPGHPVTDPHNPSANPARYAGWAHRPIPSPDGKSPPDVDHVLEHYQPERQVIAAHGDLLKAITQGRLLLRGNTIAKNHDAARAVLIKEP